MRYAAVLVVALVLAVSGALGLAPSDPAPAPPVATTTPDAGVGPVGAAQGLDATTAALQARLQELPQDDRSWAALGLAYVEQARVTGDATYYAKAEQAVAESLRRRPADNAVGHAAAAALASARHDFAAALTESEAALTVDRYDANALAVRVDALTELGRYDDAWRAVRQADARRPSIPVATRYAYQLELRGRLAESAAVLARAAAAAPPADRAHLLSLGADLDRRRDRLPQAAAALRSAVRLSPGYLPALVSRARLAVARDEPQQALRTWRVVVRRLPAPEYLTELGELYLALGRTAAAQQQFGVVETTTALLEQGGVDTDLETALFEADHGAAPAALADATAEWRKRRSIHVADALGWARHRLGQHRAALPLARRATRLGTQEARLWLHRGHIEAALGLTEAARRHLRTGLSVDPGVSPWQAAEARRALRALG